MANEAGDGGAPAGGGASDVGPGAMSGNDAFALPEDFDQNIDDGIELEQPEPAEAPVEPVPAPGQLPSGQPAAAPGQQQAPAAAPAQPAAPPAAQPAQQPVQPASVDSGQPGRIYGPGELATMLGRNRDTIIEGLATQKFQLSPQEVSALEVDAVGVLPRIMARVYYEATVNNLQQMANMVPRMVEHVANERIAESKAEADFHTQWPNIDVSNADHMRAVTMLSASFRQMFPGATLAQAIEYVGSAATNFLGLQAPVRGGNGGARPAPAAAAPRRVTAPAFAPATGGRAQPPAGTPTAPANPFAGMGMQFDE